MKIALLSILISLVPVISYAGDVSDVDDELFDEKPVIKYLNTRATGAGRIAEIREKGVSDTSTWHIRGTSTGAHDPVTLELGGVLVRLGSLSIAKGVDRERAFENIEGYVLDATISCHIHCAFPEYVVGTCFKPRVKPVGNFLISSGTHAIDNGVDHGCNHQINRFGLTLPSGERIPMPD